jgi:tripartite-type tricarboxylate transporter receptor subunit TctC
MEEQQMKAILLFTGAALISAVSASAIAQTYPSKPIRLVAPFSPGGGTSILAHVIATPVGAALGQPVIVDNRPGAGGSLGAEIVARAEPDGHTLILVSSSYCATSAYRKLPYHPVKDIEPIVLIGTTGLLMTVTPTVPAKTVKELIALARAKPGSINYASVGVGAVNHLSHELLKQLGNFDMVHVPYKGGSPALIAVISGEVQLTSVSMLPTLPHLRAGRLRALGITTLKRSPLVPDVPSISESVPGYVVNHWYGMWGPKGMPKEIVARWNKEVAKVLLTDRMKAQLRNDGVEPAAGPPSQFAEVVASDVAKWNRVIDKAGIKRR